MPKDKEIKDLTYEEAHKELESIVSELESEIHNLDAALILFERGQALARHCAELLDNAELKVKELTTNGELKDIE